MLERLRHYYAERGVRTGVINAVFAAPVTTLADLDARILAVAGFMELGEAEALVAANKRIGNILRSASDDVDGEIDEDRLNITEERELFNEITSMELELSALFDAARYDEALSRMTAVRDVIEAFFDRVMVMDDDSAVRRNRLSLLKRLKDLFDRVADLAMAH